MQNIISVDPAAWTVVKDGVHVEDLANPTEEEKRKQGLDAQVWVFITNHITSEQYHQVKTIQSAKGVWDYLEKIGEGVATQKDARIDTLRSKFHRFTHHEGENVAAIYN